MVSKKSMYKAFILLIISILIKIVSINTHWVETYYSSLFYSSFASKYRILFKWLPFSFGDLLYLFAGIVLCFYFIKLIGFFISKGSLLYCKQNWLKLSISAFIKLSMLYIIFNVCWGLNYNRQGIAQQLNLQIDKYSINELVQINELLVIKMNEAKQVLVTNKFEYPNNAELFLQTKIAYDSVSKKYPYLTYTNPSIKKSMWGWLGNYLGFLGYYNPFTGEAQVNTTGPKFAQPFTTCHEVAHQLGYAKEMEANFVGYLAASNSSNTSFKYSVYADLFTYANKTLFYADTTMALSLRKKISPAVIADFKAQRKFYASHKSFFEPVVRFIYGKFLEQNEQPQGILSYDEVTAFIIAYYKKFGTI